MISNKLYISSYDYQDFALPRRINKYTWVKLDIEICMLVEVDIPIVGTDYGFNYDKIYTFYLLNRYADSNEEFQNLSSFPINVYVLLPKFISSEEIHSLSQVQNASWATLYDNLQDAKDHRVI